MNVIYLQRCVDYIEEHLDESLNLNRISSSVGFSKYYLNTLFGIYTGTSLMSYVRRRRLYYGLKLVHEGISHAEVASKLGYSCERAFSRAVLNQYGHPPSYFKKHLVSPTSRMYVHDLQLDLKENLLDVPVLPSQKTIHSVLIKKGVDAMKSYLSDISYVKLPTMTVVCGTAFGSEPESQIIDLMHQFKDKYQLTCDRAFGFDVPVEGDSDAMDFRGYAYWLAIKDPSAQVLPDFPIDFNGTQLTIKTIPGFRYASLTIADPFSAPFERIPGGWRALASMVESREMHLSPLSMPTHIQCLEEVIESEHGQTVMKIYIPIDDL